MSVEATATVTPIKMVNRRRLIGSPIQDNSIAQSKGQRKSIADASQVLRRRRYPEAQSALSKIPLGWMLRESKSFGLLVDQAREDLVMGRTSGSRYVAPDVNGPAHESLKGAWNLAEYVPRRRYDWTTGTSHWQINRGSRRFIASGSLVHESVFQRGDQYARRLPPDVIRVT